MPQSIRYLDLAFDADFLFAQRGDLPPIRFTRMERELLREFTLRQGQLLSREHLLNALSGQDEGACDRNVDYIINRLRRKLDDDARRPHFIATRYGEGYVWLASPSDAQTDASTFFVIGPVYGLFASDAAPVLMRQLCDALDHSFGAGRRVHLVPELGVQSEPKSAARFQIETALHRIGCTLHAAFVLREFGQSTSLAALRFEFADSVDADLKAAVEALKAAFWQHAVINDTSLASVAQSPVYVHMHDAVQILTLSPTYWIENEAQLRQARAANPDDPRLMVLYACNRMTRALLSFGADDMMQPTTRSAYEGEAEALVLQSIYALHDQPNYLLAAAKLLLVFGPQHLDTAATLVERAFRVGTSFAAVFALQAQVHAARGETALALTAYDRALPMSQPESEFRVYLLVLKANALMAAGRYKAVQRVAAQLYREKPATRAQLGIQLSPPDATLDSDLAALLLGMGASRTAQLVRHAWYMGARRMQLAKHRDNMMRGLVRHAIQKYGPQVILEDVRAALPGLAGEWNHCSATVANGLDNH